jgi:hypothetical protein
MTVCSTAAGLTGPDPNPDPDGAVVVVVDDVVAAATRKSFVSEVAHVTALPPPVAVPLHWLTVTGRAEAPPVTVQPTVVSPL